MRTATWVALTVLIATPVASQDWPPPEEPYFDWIEPQFEPAEYEARRSRAVQMLSEGGGDLWLVPSGSGVTHGSTFRQDNGFNYFIGLELPRSLLVLAADGQSTLFVPETDYRFENADRRNDFPGRQLAGDPLIARHAGLPIRDAEELGAYLDSLAAADGDVWVDAGRTGPADPGAPAFSGGIEPPEAFLMALAAHAPGLRIVNAFPSVARLRMVKSAAEIAAMQRTVDATTAAIRHAATRVREGMDERTLEGEFELACKEAGSQRVAFSSIIKSGPNSLWPWRVLAAHYDRRNRSVESGDLVIFDVGCELDYYSSDVGRTFPVGGRFSDRQREALALSTAVADAIISQVRPGVTFGELLEIGTAEIPEDERRNMQTGSFFGHHVGLAVGDPALLDAQLEPGMIFTVEPWYYNHVEGIAVFVEDQVLVTEDGAIVLSGELPRDPEALERMVGGG